MYNGYTPYGNNNNNNRNDKENGPSAGVGTLARIYTMCPPNTCTVILYYIRIYIYIYI